MWHYAACFGKLEALQTLWNLAKEVELKVDELLLVKTEDGITAFYMEAHDNHMEILQKICVWTEEWQLNTNELKKKLLLAKDKNGYIAWQRATFLGRLEASEMLWSFAEEVFI